MPSSDDRPTIAAIAVLAFIVADVGHEVIGHGAGLWLAGGRSGVLTTTRIIVDQHLGVRGGNIFDLGGPAGNLIFAAVPWVIQRALHQRAPRLRLMLWLLMAFSLFWAFGYLIFCGVTGYGDWTALIPVRPHQWIWRTLFVVAGILLYRESTRLCASELRWIIPPGDAQSKPRVRRLALISYLAAGIIACAGAVLDPRGWFEVFNSGALSSFGAAIGMFQVASLFPISGRRPVTTHAPISRSWAWIAAAIATAIFYVAILGPGIIVGAGFPKK